jgi:hypothetical protein
VGIDGNTIRRIAAARLIATALQPTGSAVPRVEIHSLTASKARETRSAGKEEISGALHGLVGQGIVVVSEARAVSVIAYQIAVALVPAAIAETLVVATAEILAVETLAIAVASVAPIGSATAA